MNGRYSELTSRLGLSHALLIDGEAPDGVRREFVAAALEEALAAFELADGSTIPAPRQQAVAIRAAARLLHRNANREAVHVSLTAKAELADAPGMVQTRLLALLKLGDRERFECEVLRCQPVLTDERHRASLAPLLCHPEFQTANPNPFGQHEQFWGPVEPDLRTKLESFRRDPGRFVTASPSVLATLFALRPAGEMDRTEFEHRFRWGLACRFYILFLENCLRRAGPESGTGAADTSLLSNLVQQARAMVRWPADIEAVERRVAEGRSIVCCGAHAGFGTSLLGLAARLELPTARVAQMRQQSTSEHFAVDTSGADVPYQMVKLVKLLKGEQRLVGIVPDVRIGEVAEESLFGRTVVIGLGAPMVAHRTGAATFFARSVWNGDAFEFELVEGPTATPDLSRDDFYAAFFRFYLDGLRRILLGAPEDMAPQGGLFQGFA